MDRKMLNDLRHVIRGFTQDAKAVKTSYDALRAVALLTTGGTAELQSLAEQQFFAAISAIKSRIEQLTGVINIDGDDTVTHAAGDEAYHPNNPPHV
jgi:hypothetical protein